MLNHRDECTTCQGISSAGAQEGLDDSRSNLVSHPFRIYDRTPGAFETQQSFMFSGGCACFFNGHLSRGILLENVGAILSKNKKTRKLLGYIVKELLAAPLLSSLPSSMFLMYAAILKCPLTLCLVSICCFLLVVFDDVGGVGGYPTRPYKNPNSKSLLAHYFAVNQIQRTCLACIAPPGGPSAGSPVAVDLGEALRHWFGGLCLNYYLNLFSMSSAIVLQAFRKRVFLLAMRSDFPFPDRVNSCNACCFQRSVALPVLAGTAAWLGSGCEWAMERCC